MTRLGHRALLVWRLSSPTRWATGRRIRRECSLTFQKKKAADFSTASIESSAVAGLPLNVLDTDVRKSSTNPLAGVLEISTEDGVLRLAINGDAAKDLKIDLDQFLAQE